MGLFDIFKKKQPAAKDLLTQLLNSSRGELPALCKKHKEDIKVKFKTWSVVPEEYRNHTEKRNWYANGLINLAVCMKEMGEPECMEHLQGKGAENPLDKISRLCEEANVLSGNGNHDKAIDILYEVLTMLSKLKGPGVDFYKPRALGLMGTCYFKTGDRKNAETFTQQAYDFCISAGDEEGAKTYSTNLDYLKK